MAPTPNTGMSFCKIFGLGWNMQPDADLSPFLMEFVDLAVEEDDRIDWEESYEHGWIIRPKRVDPSQGKQDDPDKVPAFLGDGVIEYLGEQYKLDGKFRDVVETLVKLGPLNLPQLIDNSNASNPSHVLATGLRKHKFLKPFIRMPGVKCNLGYSAMIRDLSDK